MRRYDKLLISIAVSLTIINIILAFTNQSDLSAYFVANAIAYMIITLFFNINSRPILILNRMSLVLFTGFIAIIAFKLVQMVQ
jgi:hypothetical protein